MGLALGANRPDALVQIALALRRLAAALGPLRVAPLYRSAPLPPATGADFLNTVVLAESDLAPEAVLALAKRLEALAGRRPAPRGADRPLDIDLLFHGATCRDGAELTLPHPGLRRRRFVLAPLADLAPDLPLPPDGVTPRALLAALPPGQRAERWPPPGEEPAAR